MILSNALMALPYVLKVLENPMCDLAERYNLLVCHWTYTAGNGCG